jgi:hypothetical protein
MVCTFIKAYDNKKELYTSLVIELQNNNIPYSELVSTDKVFRIKAECSQLQIQVLEISDSYEFREYNELKNSQKTGLEGVLGSYNFKIDNDFLRGHFENLLKNNKLPVIKDFKDNFYRIKNRHVWFIGNEWDKKFNELKSFNLVDGEYKLIEDVDKN